MAFFNLSSFYWVSLQIFKWLQVPKRTENTNLTLYSYLLAVKNGCGFDLDYFKLLKKKNDFSI